MSSTLVADHPRIPARPAAPARGRRRGTRALVAFLLVVALALRVGLVLATPGYHPTWDARDYDALGRRVAATGQFGRPGLKVPDLGRPPGYPFFLAGVDIVTGSELKPGPSPARWEAERLAGALVGTVTVALIGLLAGRLWGRRAGLLALGAGALWLPLALVGATLLTEGLFVALELGAILCALRARGSPRRLAWLAGAGALAGLTALVHDDGVVLVVPIALAAWDRARRGRAALAGPAVVAGVFMLVLAPWTVRNVDAGHAFVPVSAHAGGTLAGVFNGAARHAPRGAAIWLPAARVPELAPILRANPEGPRRDSALLGAAIGYLDAHPAYAAEVVGVHTLRMLGFDFGITQFDFPMSRGTALSHTRIGTAWLWLLLLPALLGLGTAAARRAPRWLWSVPVLLWAATVLFSGGLRFRAPLDPFLVLGLALAADAALRRWPKGSGLTA